MICQTLNCQLETATSLEVAKVLYCGGRSFKTIFINLQDDKESEYEELIIELRSIEKELGVDATPICVFTSSDSLHKINDLADSGDIDEPQHKPVKQDVLMHYILN